MFKRPPIALFVIFAVGVAWFISEVRPRASAGVTAGSTQSASLDVEEQLTGMERLSGRVPATARSKSPLSPASGSDAVRSAIPAIPPITQLEQARMVRQRASYQAMAKLQSPTSHQVQSMRRMEQANRYPVDNHAVTDPALDPVLRKRRPPVRTQKSDDGQSALSVWSDRKQVVAGEPLVISAQAVASPSQEGASPLPLDVTPTGSLSSAEGKAAGQLFFEPAGDGTFRASVDTGRLTPGIYKAHVLAGEALSERISFSVYVSHVQLTGSYRDRIEDGQLVIETQVAVDAPGMYLIRGSLYADASTPVGSAEGRARLEEGTHWIPLRFHGRLIHDSGLAGPYRFEHVNVARRAMPASGGVDADPGFETQPYTLDAFGDAPYNDLNESTEMPAAP